MVGKPSIESVERQLRTEVLRTQPHLSEEDVGFDLSLTGELGFDSLGLETLFTRIKMEIVDTDLTPWFVQSANGGGDTLRGLATLLFVKLEEQIAAAKS